VISRRRRDALLATALLSVAAATVTAEPLEEVYVTAARNLLGQDLSAPAASEVITGLDQVSMNRTVADWMERLPGVSLNGQGGLLQGYSVRGFSRWRLRTEVDGIPIFIDRRAGNSASFIPPDLLRATTVARGPGSGLYGSGAMGGVISLDTVSADHLQVTATGQSGDNQRSIAVLAGKADSYSAGFSYRRADSAEDARGNELNSGFEQMTGLLKGQHKLGGLQLTASWLPSIGEDIGKSSALYPEDRISDYPQQFHSLSRLQLKQGQQWLVQFTHHYQDWDSHTQRVGGRRNETNYLAHTVGGLFYHQADWAQGEGRWGLEWTGRRGVDIEDREFDADGTFVAASQLIDGEQDNLALFANQQWRVGAATFGGGLRYDHVELSNEGVKRSDQNLGLTLNTRWVLSQRWSLDGELASGFRFPELTELYFNGVTPRGDTLGNPDLQPEKNRALQGGLQYDDGRLRAGINAYYNQLQDYIERYRVNDDLRSYRNIDDASIWGYELSLSWHPGERWSHELSYQWQQGEDEHGNTLADLNPPGLRYLLGWDSGWISASSDLSYRESRSGFGSGEQPLSSALIWNARLKRSLGDAWQLELYAANLLDETYRGAADEDAAYQPGRTVGFRVSWAHL
jgi:vitamin B12 transporter